MDTRHDDGRGCGAGGLLTLDGVGRDHDLRNDDDRVQADEEEQQALHEVRLEQAQHLAATPARKSANAHLLTLRRYSDV